MDNEPIQELIDSYSLVLQELPQVPYHSESELPFPKNTIRRAIASALLKEIIPSDRNILEDAYLQLENFLPPEEFEIVDAFTSLAFDGEVLVDEIDRGLEDSGDLENLMKKMGDEPSRRAIRLIDIVGARIEERQGELQAIRNIVGFSGK